MKIGCAYLVPISRFGFPPKPEDNLTAIEDVGNAGFDGIEFEAIAGQNLEGIAQLQAEIRASLDQRNLDVASFTAVIPELYSSDSNKLNESLATFRKMAELAQSLGTSVIDFCPYLPPELAGVKGSNSTWAVLQLAFPQQKGFHGAVFGTMPLTQLPAAARYPHSTD